MQLTKKEIVEDLENVLHDLENGEIYDTIIYLGEIVAQLKMEVKQSEEKTQSFSK